MAVFISDYFGFQDQLTNAGVFDAIIDEDSNFFINIVRLRTTNVPEFRESYGRLNKFFSEIATLLEASDHKDDKFFRAAYNRFDFSEVNGINLGFSESRHGSGFGPELRIQVIRDAFDIVKKGSNHPEIFHRVGSVHLLRSYRSTCLSPQESVVDMQIHSLLQSGQGQYDRMLPP